MAEYGRNLISEKRARPTDDMLSVVVHASLDDAEPPTLSDDELYAFFSLFFSAGAETTRNAFAGGLLALLDEPDQISALLSVLELLVYSVEEIIRWTTTLPP